MSRIIELPDEVYENLARVAREQGLTAASWIANAVPAYISSGDTVFDRLEGLVGAVNSTKAPAGGQSDRPFSELLALSPMLVRLSH